MVKGCEVRRPLCVCPASYCILTPGPVAVKDECGRLLFPSPRARLSRGALRRYRIELVFESEELRLQWVASREHQEAFPRIAALCQRVSWSGFEVVHQRT